MFNPEMMKAAQEQFMKMTPEQRNAMMGQMKNINPEMLKKSQEAMKNMTADDIRKMNMNGNPAAQLEQQTRYMLNGAISIKTEGNNFVKAQNYASAKEKYVLAIQKLKELPTQTDECRAEIHACNSNLALCHLKLGSPASAVEACESILVENPKHVKALFRRGQARAELGDLVLALADVQMAHELSPEDAAAKAYFEELKSKVGADEEAVKAAREAEEARLAAAAKEKKEKEDAERAKVFASMTGTDEATAKMMAKTMENPAAVNQAFSAMGGAAPAPAAAAGKPKVKETGVKVEEITSEDEKEKEEDVVIEEANPGFNFSSAPVAKPTPAAAATSPMGGAAPSMDEMMNNPEMMDRAMKMMSSMSPEDMQELMTLGQSLMSPSGQPDMNKAQEVLTSKPELLTRLMKGFVNNASDEDMANMAKSVGMAPEQLKAATKAMGSIDDKYAKWLFILIGYLMKAWNFLVAVKNFFASQQAALYILVIAVVFGVLRMFGMV